MIKPLLVIFCFSLNLPQITFAQQSEIGGLWLLKEKSSLRGTDYDNGVPKVINIEQNSEQIKFEFHNRYRGKDTSEVEVFLIGVNKPNETITTSNRKKTAKLYWDIKTGEWVKQATLSERGNLSSSEIKVGEQYRVSDNLSEMTLIKTYDGNDSVNENSDYSVLAVYEKTTPEKLARDTATGKGVRFVQGLTWQQILDKSKAENKMIFVDCYATWCLPCKKMDKEVFPLNVVGEEMNETFICVKVQMDTGKADSREVQMLYGEARKLESNYNITVLPSYLFFDQNGNVLHKATGSFNRSRFLETLRDVSDPSKQIYTLFKKAMIGQMPLSEIDKVARKLSSREYGEKKLGAHVARLYFENYLYKLDRSSFFTKIDFFSEFRDAIESKDSVFQYLLKNVNLSDSLSGKGSGFIAGIIRSVITKEEIMPFVDDAMKKGTSPDWNQLERKINKKFPGHSKMVVINAKTNWYLNQKDWKRYCENLELQIGLLGGLSNISFMTLNSAAWQIFLHSTKKSQLQTALKWSNASIENQMAEVKGPPFKVLLDTYGNLLYKLGRKKEAIKFYSEKIINPGHVHKSFYETFEKMIAGKATWPTE